MYSELTFRGACSQELLTGLVQKCFSRGKEGLLLMANCLFLFDLGPSESFILQIRIVISQRGI